MAVTHTTAVRDTITNTVVDLIDGGTGAGNLVIRATGSTAASPAAEVATLAFENPAFGASSSGTATRAGTIVSDTNATGGTAAFATLEDGDAAVIAHCSVAASGADINLSTVTIGAGATVSMSNLTYTAGA